MDRHKSFKIQVWVPHELYDLCKELVDYGEMFDSMSDLVRRGMQYMADEHSGYAEMVREEIANKYGPSDMGGWIYTGTCYVRVNARWMARYGNDKMGYMIEDINDNPMPHAALEDKYGTDIEIVDTAQWNILYGKGNRTKPSSTSGSGSWEDSVKETWAYKQEHGLL